MEFEKVRQRASYKKFKELFEFFDNVPTPTMEDILKKFHHEIDFRKGFGSQKNSDAAMESLELVIRDKDEERIGTR